VILFFYGRDSRLPWGDTLEVPKFTFIKLAFNAILELLGMTTWGVGSITFNVQAKMECDVDLAIVI
jgi:hypothetical protein